MKSEIREQLHHLTTELYNIENLSASEIKEIALGIYNKATILEFLQSSKTEVVQPAIPGRTDYAPHSGPSRYKTFSFEKTEDEPIAEEEQQNPQFFKETENKDLEKPVPLTKEPEQAELPKKEPLNELEQFAAEFQKMPEFERKNPFSESFSSSKNPSQEEKKEFTETKQNEPLQPLSKKFAEHKPKSLNDTVNRGLTIGLNDRLAFINQLFEGEIEDYTRVLSQINTLSSFEEAKNFIETRVKPDYNNWQNKEEISNRFMMIIEKTFN